LSPPLNGGEHGGRQRAPFRFGHAAGADWRTVAAHCLAQIGDGPGRDNFGWLYLTDQFADDAAEILAFLAARLGIETWIGTTGIGVCATGTEYFDTAALAVMVGELPRDSVFPFATARRPMPDLFDDVGEWRADNAGGFGIVHGDPRDGPALRRIDALAEGTQCFLVGALASSRGRHPQIADGMVEGGLSGALFAPSLTVVTGLTQGCTPIGPAHELTAAQDNVAIELDGKPALEVLKADVGEILARDLSRIAGYIFAARPVRGSDWGDYLVRNLTGFDSDQGLLAIGDDLSDGGQLMFCRRDRAAAEEDLRRMLGDVKSRLDGPPRGALYHSCLARGPNMFDGPDGELGIIRDELGPIPMVGLFGNGEISAGRLYTYTGVLTVFV